MTYKAIIFDLGQVVYKAGFTRRYELLCKQYNVEPSTSLFQEFRGIWNKVKIGKADSSEFFSAIANKIKISPEEVKKTLVEDISLNEKVRDLILKLKEKYKIGILTNNIKDFYEADLELWNFEEVGEVVASFKEGIKKPDTEAIELMLKRLNISKEEAVFIDDHNDTTSRYNKFGVRSITFTGYDELLINLKSLGIEV